VWDMDVSWFMGRRDSGPQGRGAPCDPARLTDPALPLPGSGLPYGRRRLGLSLLLQAASAAIMAR
jgi:hypothetical protein